MTSPLRVLALCSAFPPVSGGAETYADVLTAGLAARGHDVLVLTDAVPGAPGRQDGTRSVRRLGGYRNLLDDPSKLPWEQLYFGLLPEVAEAIEDWPPDIVLANNLETTILGRIVAEHAGVPLVGSYHEHAPDSEPLGAGKLALAYRWLAPDAVLAGSRYYAERARRYLRADRVHLIHHGVDTEVFRCAPADPRVRKRYGVAPDSLLVVNVGRLKERKGQLELVHALAALDDRRVHLVIAGSVSSASLAYSAALNSTIKAAGLDDRVTVDRNLSHLDIPELLAAADIVVQPSTSEGLGLALLEAMSAGRPTIATRIDGFLEILEAGAPADAVVELVEPGDVAGLGRALNRLAGDPRRRAALGVAARAYVQRHFSQRTMIERTERVLRRLREERPAHDD